MKNILSFLMISVFVSSCSDEPPQSKQPEPDKKEEIINNEVDTVLSTVEEDSEEVVNKEIDTSNYEMDEKVSKEDELSFCECIKKQHEINQKIEKSEDDAEMERLFDELTEVDEECQIIFAAYPQSTPEERSIRQRKVKECLR